MASANGGSFGLPDPSSSLPQAIPGHIHAQYMYTTPSVTSPTASTTLLQSSPFGLVDGQITSKLTNVVTYNKIPLPSTNVFSINPTHYQLNPQLQDHIHHQDHHQQQHQFLQPHSFQSLQTLPTAQIELPPALETSLQDHKRLNFESPCASVLADTDRVHHQVLNNDHSSNISKFSNDIVTVKIEEDNRRPTGQVNHGDKDRVLTEALTDVKHVSVVWKSVRERILTQFQIWDLILDKASFRYFYDTKSKKLPKDNERKFRAVVTEMEALLGEFKCFMDGCLTEDNNEKNSKAPGINLGPELCRAYDEKPSKKWILKNSINPLYSHFFSGNDYSDASGTAHVGDFPFATDFDDFEDNFVEDSDKYMNEEEEEENEQPLIQEPKIGQYKCIRCNRRYTRQSYLDRHLKTCKEQPAPTKDCMWHRRESDGELVCDVNGCNIDSTFNSNVSLWQHFQEDHALQEDFVFKCTFCNESFVHPDVLQVHMTQNHPGEEMRQDFSFKGELVNGAEDIENQYKCDLCDFSTTAMNGLSLHKRRLHRIDKNNETVTQVDNPDFHERDPKKFKHECYRCTRRYKKMHHLDRHLPKCDGIPPPIHKPMWSKNTDTGRFSCAVPGCGSDKTWTSSFSVWHHFNSEHADMQDDSYCVFKCDMCDKKFPNKSMLTRHRNHKHESLFRFQCTKCPKRLASNKLLKLHMTQHTGEKPYGCDLCEYKAITQSIVNQHKMRMHEGSIPNKVLPKHVCDTCGKSFKVLFFINSYYLLTKTGKIFFKLEIFEVDF
jgi:hypothetical protein